MAVKIVPLAAAVESLKEVRHIQPLCSPPKKKHPISTTLELHLCQSFFGAQFVQKGLRPVFLHEILKRDRTKLTLHTLDPEDVGARGLWRIVCV